MKFNTKHLQFLLLCQNQFERRQRRGPRLWKQQKTEILQMRTE